MKISGLVISFNEEDHIGKCLKSLRGVADEVIVIDSFSEDQTPKICKAENVRFYQREYPGQIEQKLFALSLATYPVILSLDADEELNEELRQEILTQKSFGFPCDGYFMNRKSFYCGEWIHHGAWSPEWKLRLWHKEKADWLGPNPHDKVYPHSTAKLKKLDGLIYHYTFKTQKEHINQVNKYASISAQSYFVENVKLPHIRSYLSPVVYFLKYYLMKGGFRDGKLGWQITRLAMKEKYQKYQLLAKLRRT